MVNRVMMAIVAHENPVAVEVTSAGGDFLSSSVPRVRKDPAAIRGMQNDSQKSARSAAQSAGSHGLLGEIAPERHFPADRIPQKSDR